MKKTLLVLIIGLVTATSCKKDKIDCWDCYDYSGNLIQTSCGTSEQDAFNNSGNINGVHDINTFRQFCHKK